MIYFDEEPDDALLNEAVAIAKNGATLDERDALIRFMYGRALLARKSYGEALAELEIAAELNPNLAVVYCGLGDSLAYEGRIDEAIPYFQRAINLSPNDSLSWAFYSSRVALSHPICRSSSPRNSSSSSISRPRKKSASRSLKRSCCAQTR